MTTLKFHKPTIKFNFENINSSSLDYREELKMFKNIDRKIENEIFIKNILGIKKNSN